MSLPNRDLNIKPRGRQKGWTRQGSVLSGKGLTEAEAKWVQTKFASDKARWEYLLHPDRNRWFKRLDDRPAPSP